ncbi:hypothetical protein LINPERHAP1_LOCUS13962 [Linum perenne]
MQSPYLAWSNSNSDTPSSVRFVAQTLVASSNWWALMKAPYRCRN